METVWIVETYDGCDWEIDSVYSTEPGAMSRAEHLYSMGWRRGEVSYEEIEVRH